MDRTKVRITKSEISMRTGRCPMSAAAQGAFVDIFYIIKKPASDSKASSGGTRSIPRRVVKNYDTGF